MNTIRTLRQNISLIEQLAKDPKEWLEEVLKQILDTALAVLPKR
jgi:hypothetical protein